MTIKQKIFVVFKLFLKKIFTLNIFLKIYMLKENFFKIYIKKKNYPKILNDGFKIPLIVHQSWVDNNFPQTIGKKILSFRNLNTDIQFNLYNNSDVCNFMKKFYKNHEIFQIFKRAKFWQMKADIFRYCVVYEKGGFWFDIKSGVNNQLSNILDTKSDMLISFEGNKRIIKKKNTSNKLQHPKNWICNWGFAARKKCRVLKNQINNICKYFKFYEGKTFKDPKIAILELTGPRMFTHTIVNELKKKNSIRIQQVGVDFNNLGIYAHSGADVLWRKIRHYSQYQNTKIIN